MKSKLAKRMLALLLAMVLITGTLPVSAFAEEAPVYSSQLMSASDSDAVELPEYIFSDSWNQEYDILYYEEGGSYTFAGQNVTFPDENTVNVGDTSYSIKNAVTEITAVTTDGVTEIFFKGLKIPVGGISGAWNSNFDGRFALHYQMDGAPVPAEETDRISTVKLTIDTPESGIYSLTGGKIFEGANEYSGGFDFEDGNGVVTEREFGYLPDINLAVEVTVPTEPEEPSVDKTSFTAKIGDQELSVNKRDEQEYCGAVNRDVDIYDITVPADAEKFQLCGLVGNYSYNAEGITGGDVMFSGDVELDITDSTYYHIKEGWSKGFHIYFIRDKETEPAPPEPVEPETKVPFTAKIGDAELTVEKVEDVLCDATYQKVPVYQITIPEGTTEKTMSVSGVTGWGYSENTCIGASDGTVEGDVWETNILGVDEYYHMSKYPDGYHITFKHLGDFEPAGPTIPFTAKAGNYDLEVVKTPRAGHYGNDLYTVQVPASVKGGKVFLGGLAGNSHLKNQLNGKLESIPADPWETDILGKDEYYIISDSSTRTRYEIKFAREQAVEISAALTAQMEGTFLLPPETEAKVEAGLAGFYGYVYGDNVAEDDVTALDALVKMHQIVYGEDDISEHLAVSESGWITKAFDEPTGSVGFMVNGEMPTTMINETVLKSKDVFDFFKYQDAGSFSDKAVWLEQKGKKQKHFEAAVNAPLTLTVKGSDYNGNVSAVSGLQLATVDEYGNTEPITGAVTDQEGKASVTFDKAGDYTITVLSSENTKVIMPIAYVSVSSGTVSISVEARTIGEGDLLEQAALHIKGDKTTVKDVLDAAASQNKLKVEYSEDRQLTAVNGFRNIGEGSWRYEINGKAVRTAMDKQDVSAGDVIRIRYAVTAGGEELNAPLYEYLNKLVQDAKEKLKGAYTENSKAELRTAVEDADKVLADKSNNSQDADKEILVSTHIGAINKAVANLVREDTSIADPAIPDDFENDLWLQYDYMEMQVGENSYIYPRRVPQIVDNVIANNVTRPNFNFEVIRGNSIALSAEDSTDKVQVSALRDGVSIVKVTYDAEGKYGACSSVNAAYVVYDVNSDPADLEISADYSSIRSYDTLYYSEGDTLPYTFNVDVPGASKVEVSCNDHVLTPDKNGSYTAQLENRSNIMGIRAYDEKGRVKSRYQVIDARKININVENITHPGKDFQINDKAKISFRGITMPVYKLAKIYNPCSGGHDDLNQKDTWPTSVSYRNDSFGEVNGFCGQWDLATKNSFEVTFTKDGVYNFTDGQILCNWWGSPLGTDKDNFGDGDPNLAAPIMSDYFSVLPDFSINVGNDSGENVPVEGITLNKKELTLTEGEKFQLVADVIPDKASNRKVKWSCDDKNGTFITVDKSGEITAKKANNSKVPFVTVTATTDEGKFTAECKVTVKKSDEPELPPSPPAPESKDSVVLTVEGHTVNKGYVVKPVEIKLKKNDTVYTVLERYTKEKKISMTASYNAAYGSYYVSEIGGIAEMDHGPGSGWMYFVNDEKPNYGASEYKLDGGEVIRWRYTTNLGADLKPDVKPESKHKVTASKTANGKVTVPSEAVKAGDTVTVTAKADKGYTLKKLTVTDKAGTSIPVVSGKSGKFTFTMPDFDVNVAAKFEKIPAKIPDYKKILEETGKNLSGKTNGFGGEWVAMGLARHPYPVSEDYFDNYYGSVENYVKEMKGVLSSRKYTEYSRTILALTAAGYDVTDVGGYDLTAPLADFDKVNYQGINGTIFALIALDSHDYEIPTAPKGTTQTTREKLLEKILESALPDGGWTLSGDKANVDTTAMAIQALAPYYQSDEAVKSAVDKALDMISKTQGAGGNWLNQDGENSSETPAQVLVALTALGIDPARDDRFIKNGRTVIDAICDFYLGKGEFSHIDGAPADGMATEQSYYALVSYLRFCEGKTSLYDMSDVTIRDKNPKPSTPDSTDHDNTNHGNSGPKPMDPKPGNPGNNNRPGNPGRPGRTPTTGDDTPIGLLIGLMAASALGLAVIIKKRKDA